MQTTALTDKHIALGAKMTDFAGYNMPLTYTNLREEHETVRNGVGMFDVSHMGEFIVRGKGALEFLQYVTTNNVAKLEIGDAQYSCFPNGKGGIVDDLLIYRLTEEHCSNGERSYMLVVNASNIEKDWAHLQQYVGDYEVQMINISEQTGLLAIQGPKAAEAIQILTTTKLSDMKYYTFVKDTFASVDNVIISATGYTGAGGFEIYVNNKDVAKVWDAVMTAGASQGIKPIGLGARDTLRLEMGYCLYGNDIDDTTSPIEGGLGWITKTKKGEFVDRDLYVQQRKEGVARKLVGFKVDARRAPRHDYLIEDMEGNEIGIVTSGTISPSLGYPVGLGYVKKAFSKADTPIQIVAGKKRLAATVTRPPFYKA
ncbi:MAG: glycine cleavage system aminomethyltransferase GcvT [Saprospiraceae bacterium]